MCVAHEAHCAHMHPSIDSSVISHFIRIKIGKQSKGLQWGII